MMTTTSTRLALVLALVVALGGQSAHAQSSYSLTAVQGEFSAGYAGYKPQNTCLDNSGKVFGHRKQYSIVMALLQALNGPGPLGTGNYLRAATWSASKSATVSPVNMALPTATYDVFACSENGVYQAVMNSPIQAASTSGIPVGLVKQGKLGNIPNPQKDEVQPWAVNNSGWVAGVSESAGGNMPRWRATLWRDNQSINLPAPGWDLATAADINNQGVVVGRVFTVPANPQVYPDDYRDGHAARWVNGKLDWVLADSPGVKSSALAINDAGQVLIAFYGGDWRVTGCAVWANGALTPLSPGKAVWVNDINASGVIAGQVGGRAVIWKNGVEIDVTGLVTSKGVKLPAGVVLDEVLRINDGGFMVATYRTTVDQLWPTTVRLNALP